MTKNRLNAVLIAATIFAFGCKKENNKVEYWNGSTHQIKATYIQNGDKVPANTTVSAVVNDWGIMGYRLASAPYQNNSFEIELLPTVNSQYLKTIDKLHIIKGDIIVSNPETGFCTLSIAAYSYEPTPGVMMEAFGGFKLFCESTRYDARYYYASQSVTVTGTYTHPTEIYTIIDTWDCYFQEGWNIVYSKYDYITNASMEIQQTHTLYTTNRPQGSNFIWSYKSNWGY